jgi:predicted permease
MQWIGEGWRRLAFFFRRGQFQRELKEEMDDHVRMKVKDLTDEGMPSEEARNASRREFGNALLLREESRDPWGFRWLETLIQDIRYGVRQLRRSPGFTVVAVLTLAVGIGGTTAIYSVVDGVLLQPLPYPQPSRLVEVAFTRPGKSHVGLSQADYLVFRGQSRTFQDLSMYAPGIKASGNEVNVTGSGEPERVAALPVTDDLLAVLGVTPLFGRSFTRADYRVGSPDTVLLTYGYWRSKFGGDRAVIGKTIDADGRPRVIIGVLPQRFRFLDMTNLAMLLPLKLEAKTTLGEYYFGAIARLKPGATIAEANADVARMIPIVLRSFPAPAGESFKLFEDLRLGPNVRPLKEAVTGDVSKVLWVMMVGMSLVLVIACGNLANLLLVRAEGRQQELAVRAALGATRRRIAAGLFSESLILAMIGGLIGLGLAYAALRVLVAIAPLGLPRLNEIGIDGKVVLFALAVSAITSLLFGSIPTFKYSGASLGIRLREGGRSMSESRERHRTRGMLVIAQVALALVLLVSSGLMIRTFRALTRVNPGFIAPSQLQTFCVYIADDQVRDPERVVRVEKEIADKIAALPGVSSVGISRNLPMDGSRWNDTVVARDRVYAPSKLLLYPYEFVSPGFLKTLGTPLVAGRDFTWSDTYNKLPVAMVSEHFARQYWYDPATALGKQIRQSAKDEWREVVGVVGDVRQDGVDEEAPSSVYWPMLAAHFDGVPVEVRRNVAFAIRSPRAGSKSLMDEIRRAVWSVDPDLPLFEVHTLNYYYTKSMARTSFTLVLLALSGGMALLLGIVGLYGVIAYLVSQRTHEIGIRMALGAQKRDVLSLVLAGAMSLTVIGVGIGIAAALVLTRFLSGLLYGVKPNDPLTFVAVSFVLIGVALLACYIPARRATKVDPMEALRYE